MSKPSSFSVQLSLVAAKMAAKYEAQREMDFRLARQMMADLAFIAIEEALHVTPDELAKVAEELNKLHSEYADVWNADSEELEYSFAVLDRRLKPICGDGFIPASERYEGTLRGSR